jgi:hypothetical protein
MAYKGDESIPYEKLSIDEIRQAGEAFCREENERDRKIRMLEYINYIYNHTQDGSGGTIGTGSSIASENLGKEYTVYARNDTFVSSSSGIRNVAEYIRSCEGELVTRGTKSVCMESKPKDDHVKRLNQEIVLGLGEHDDAHLVMRRNEHAPPPWDIITDNGNSIRLVAYEEYVGETGNTGNTELRANPTKCAWLIDRVGKLVLSESSHGPRVKRAIEDMSPYILSSLECENPNEPGEYEDAPLDALVCPLLMSMYRNVKKRCIRGDDKNYRHIQKTLYDNFMECGNAMMPLTISKVHHHIQREYGFKKHIMEHDDKRGIALVSYSITDRYHLCIFFCVNKHRIQAGNHRVAQLLFRPSRSSGSVFTGGSDKGTSGKGKEKARVQGKSTGKRKPSGTSGISSYFTTSTGDESYGKGLRDKRRKGVISTTGALIERSSKIARKGREERILKLCTNGILEVAIYSCSCNRSFVRL